MAEALKENCAICQDTDTDYELKNCAHRFHVFCLCETFVRHHHGIPLRCPLCRQDIHPEDEWGPWQTVATIISKGD